MIDAEDIKKQDIFDALNVIKTVCYNNTCEFCPFGGSGICHIKISDPEDWDIEEVTIWRALNNGYLFREWLCRYREDPEL